MEDIDKEEVGQLVDPEDFGGGEEWDVVQSCRVAKTDSFGSFTELLKLYCPHFGQI